MERRIKLRVAYLGAGFHGWQRQPSQRTVQGELEHAFSTMTAGIAVTFVGAGRTDAGVHAAGQVAHIDLPVAIPPAGLEKGLNQHLPPDVRVRDARPTRPDFHARKDARGKLYTYRLRWHEPALPWLGLRSAILDPVSESADLGAALELLPGRHDMASFTVPEAATGSTTRTLFDVRCRHRRSGLDLDFIGDGFLRYQVRRMVGALLEVARGRLSVTEFRHLLERPRAGVSLPTAPARGLTLEHVYYRDPERTARRDPDSPAERRHDAAISHDEHTCEALCGDPVVDSEPPG